MKRGMARILIPIIALLAPSAALAEDVFERGHQLGFSLGTPIGLNAEYAYEFGGRAISLCGAYYGRDGHGIQAGLSLERTGDARKAFSVNFVGGHIFFRNSDDPDPNTTYWTYAGLEANLRYRRLFLAPVLSFGGGRSEGDRINNPLLLARLGLIWPL